MAWAIGRWDYLISRDISGGFSSAWGGRVSAALESGTVNRTNPSPSSPFNQTLASTAEAVPVARPTTLKP